MAQPAMMRGVEEIEGKAAARRKFGELSTLVSSKSSELPICLPKAAFGGPTDAVEQARVFEALFRQGAEPTTLGRYVVLDTLGEGGMGVVLRAFDRELDRPVALKVLHEHLAERHTTRLRREAQAMARLSHPNVVQVYEVGEVEGRTFVAMELVKGQTPRQWMEQDPRPDWRACVRLFIGLGEGLAAAHERGLVHRDFKPGNAIIDGKGRPRVLDFGLVRQDGEEDVEDPVATERARTGPQELVPLEKSLTRTGTVLGTPAYMPPEQMEGREADPRSDQFSFCVSLYEAVYGERPYEGSSMAALMMSVREGAVRPPPKGIKAPATLRRTLLRGLAIEPDQRWPSMEALLLELRRLVVPRGRRWMAMGLTASAIAIGGGLAIGEYLQLKDRCTGAQAQLQGVWDDTRRGEVRAALLGTELSYAPATWERVEQRLDAYGTALAAEHTEACEATSVRHEQSAAQMDLRMGCLRGRRQLLRATVDELGRADATVVEHAVQAVASLPDLSRCADVEALSAEVPPPEDPAVAKRVEELEQRLAEAQAKEQAGKYEDGLEVAEQVTVEAKTLGYEPLLARAQVRQGVLQEKFGDYEHSATTLRNAYDVALGQGLLVEAAEASGQLVYTLGYQLVRPEEADRWSDDADPLSRAARTETLRALYLSNRGSVAYKQGKYEDARDFFSQSLAIRERSLDPDHPSVASSLVNLGNVAYARAEYDEAHDLYRRGLAIWEESVGPAHPYVATSLTNLGTVAYRQLEYTEAHDAFQRALVIREQALGPDHPHVAISLNALASVAKERHEYGQARDLYQRALRIFETALGPEHPDVTMPLVNLGNVAKRQGKYEEAHDLYQRALAISEKRLGPEHPEVARSLNNLGILSRVRGKPEQAHEFHQRALAIRERALGPDHPDVAGSLDHLANLANGKGEYEQALELHRRALSIWERSLGPDDPAIAVALVGIGENLTALDKPAEALTHLERALTLRVTHEVEPDMLAENRVMLARALWSAPAAQGRDRLRARALAEHARDAYAELGEVSTAELAEVQAWLDEHRVP